MSSQHSPTVLSKQGEEIWTLQGQCPGCSAGVSSVPPTKLRVYLRHRMILGTELMLRKFHE